MANIGTNEAVTFTAGRMNKSVDERLLPEGEYIDALNIRIGSTELSSVGAIENALGNERLTTIQFNSIPLSNDAECIGAYEDGANETIYWFVTDPGVVDMVLSYNVGNQTLKYHVVSTSVLNFNKQYRINGVNLINDLLFWTDNYNPPRKININRSYPLPGVTDGITEEDINVIVAPPMEAPSIELLNIAGEENYITDKFISFAYRYKYVDGEYSALSKFTDIAFEPGAFNLDYSTYTNSGMENIFNTVKVSFNTGDANVVGVDVCFKYSNSNIVNVIEKYKKQEEGWLDNTVQDILFNNKKIYTTLPESELLRIYDNVPRFAKAQTNMGNRMFYGNYVDGYDIDTEIDYTVKGISDEIGKDLIPVQEVDGVDYSIDPTSIQNVTDSKIDINLEGIDLKEGLTLVIDFNLIHSSFSGSSLYPSGAPLNSFQEVFYFTFPRDYSSVYDLGTDQAFIDAIYTHQPINTSGGLSLTDLFNTSLVTKQVSGPVPAWTKSGSGISNDDGGFQITVSTGSNVLGIQAPAMKFEVESPAGTMNYAYEYFENVSTEVYISTPGSKKSLHSNRDYELAIVYMDDYGRRSTALTCTGNTVFFPESTSDTRNYLQVAVNNIPPSWASKYEFVLKPSKAAYETIFSNIFFVDEDGYTWFKLEGDNRSKVKENENLIVKADSTGVLNSLVKTKVLGIEAKSSDFINGGVVEPAGTYMKLKASNFQAIFQQDSFISREIQSYGSNYPITDIPLYQDNPNYDSGSPIGPGNEPYMPIPIPAGSLIKIQFYFWRNGAGRRCGSRNYYYEKNLVSNQDYDSFYDFIEGQHIDFTSGQSSGGDDVTNQNIQYHNIVDYVNISCPDPQVVCNGTIGWIDGANQYQFAEGFVNNDPLQPKDGRLYLVLRSGTPTCSGKNSNLNGYITIQQAGTTFIFETEPLEANGEIFYENDQVFDIVNGYHQGNVSDQTSAFDSAISNLDFFNCFSFGNGCESYKIGDALAGVPFYLGSRVTAVSREDYKAAHRYASITYSGVYNEDTNINKLNEYNLALANYKDLEKVFGPIEVLYGRKTDLLVLQEDKISYVLQGKNLLSDAAGGGAIASIPEVLGTQISRIEENGISNNPESFTVYGSEIFFTDVKRSAVLNLRGGSSSADQLIPISDTGMKYWFRDEFKNSLNKVKLGGYDPYMSEYVLSIKDDLLPQDPDVFDCGTILSKYNSSEESTYYVNLGELIGNVKFVADVTEGDVTVKIDYDGVEVYNQNLEFKTNIEFTKPTATPTEVKVTVIPNNSTFSIGNECIENQKVNIVKIVLNSPASEGLTTHTRYRWALGSSISPYDTEFITMNASGISLNESITGMTSEGIIPSSGSDIVMVCSKNSGDTYNFDASNSFKYLSSNTLYDIPTLLPLLNNVTPILNPSTDVYQAIINDFNYSGSYLYMVWDLRISKDISLCYSDLSEYDVCCNCAFTNIYHINADTFFEATSIYTDSNLTVLAPDGFYNYQGTYRQLLDGVLLDPIACPDCADCITWLGGTFKGAGGFDATFSYLDCDNISQEIIVPIPSNVNPGDPMAYEVNLGEGVCVIQGSVQLLIPSVIPALTIEYGDECSTPPVDCLEFNADPAGFPGNIYYTDCFGNPQEVYVDDIISFCAQSGTVTTSGPIISIIGNC